MSVTDTNPIAALRELHRSSPNTAPPFAGGGINPEFEPLPNCRHCQVPWPCRTAQLLRDHFDPARDPGYAAWADELDEEEQQDTGLTDRQIAAAGYPVDSLAALIRAHDTDSLLQVIRVLTVRAANMPHTAADDNHLADLYAIIDELRHVTHTVITGLHGDEAVCDAVRGHLHHAATELGRL